MAASHFKRYWSFRQNKLPPQIKRESGESLKKYILNKYGFVAASSLRDPQNQLARQQMIQIGGGMSQDVPNPNKKNIQGAGVISFY